MSNPLGLTAGVEDRPIGHEAGVSARVFRFGLEWERASRGASWQVLLPLAVVDSRFGRPHVHPIVDANLAFTAAALLSLLAIRRISRRPHRG